MLVQGKKVSVITHTQREAVNAYNDYILCKKFGWTEDQILDTSESFYNQMLLIMSKENAFIDREQKKQANKIK